MRFGPDDDPDVGPAIPDPEALAEPIRRLFLAIVILLNVGILLVSLGLMIIGFEGRVQLGAMLILAGGFILLRAWQRYRRRHDVFEQVE